MIALLQRVTEAQVSIAGEAVAGIQQGLLVLLGIVAEDDDDVAKQMVKRLLHYRVFADADGKMNLSLKDIGGGLLLVPQFTLVADTGKGRRPSFSAAASPTQARVIFEALVAYAHKCHTEVGSGNFGADMQVQLINDGPVSFILD